MGHGPGHEVGGQAPGQGSVVNPRPDIYVASSWANPIHIAVCAALKAAGLSHYNFKDEEGFHWSEVMPGWAQAKQHREGMVDPDVYLNALEHPRARQGYVRDFAAMQAAHTFVLVLPAGRSSHLELGWAVGQGKRTAVLLDDPCVPELMYTMVDFISPSLMDLLGWLGVVD